MKVVSWTIREILYPPLYAIYYIDNRRVNTIVNILKNVENRIVEKVYHF